LTNNNNGLSDDYVVKLYFSLINDFLYNNPESTILDHSLHQSIYNYLHNEKDYRLEFTSI